MRAGILLSISKTENEWEAINDKMNGKDLNVYLRMEISKLIASFNECPDCISCAGGKKKEKRPVISRKQYEEIEKIAEKMQITPSKVIDRLIISPMLLPD